MHTDIALTIAQTADSIMNGLLILVLAYFSLICIGGVVREVSDARKRRTAARKKHVH